MPFKITRLKIVRIESAKEAPIMPPVVQMRIKLLNRLIWLTLPGMTNLFRSLIVLKAGDITACMSNNSHCVIGF